MNCGLNFYGRGQLRETEGKSNVHQRHQQRSDQKADGAGGAPAVVPAKVFAGNDQANGDGLEVDGGEGAG